MAGFYSELRRRRVFATVSIYLVAAWLFIQVSDVLFPGWNIAEENIRYLLYAAIAAIRAAVSVGWRGLYGGMLYQPPVMLDSLAGNPEYEALVVEINADLVLQLQRVKAMDL